VAHVAEIMGDPAGYALAFAEGKAAIAGQQATLKETRDRIGLLISVAGVVGSLAASIALRGETHLDLDWWGIVGLIAGLAGFAVIATGAVCVWWPTKGVFNLDPAMIVGSYVEGPDPAALVEIHRDLAVYMGNHIQVNRVGLDGKLRLFSWSLVGFAFEVGGLTLMIWNIKA